MPSRLVDDKSLRPHSRHLRAMMVLDWKRRGSLGIKSEPAASCDGSFGLFLCAKARPSHRDKMDLWRREEAGGECELVGEEMATLVGNGVSAR